MDELKKIDRDVEYEKQKTQLKKEKFIKDIKSGLGTHIKNSGGRVNKIKKSKFKRFWNRLMNMF
jgi:predicted site-specific integrase-resolvase|tara:strand:+ start:469 stop:660 length:192 start_codon:yes stop_codon:yes gene_type:complete